MHNVCNICMPQTICDVISSIGIGIGAAAADSIRYWAPARSRYNPNKHRLNMLLSFLLVQVLHC